MTMTVGLVTAKIGDSFFVRGTLKSFMVDDVNRETGVVSMLYYDDILEDEIFTLDADVFMYYVINGTYVKQGEPLYMPGDTFRPHLGNYTLEVVSVSPTIETDRKEHMYFCAYTASTAARKYFVLPEGYLTDSIKQPRRPFVMFPEIPEFTELPVVVFEDTP